MFSCSCNAGYDQPHRENENEGVGEVQVPFLCGVYTDTPKVQAQVP